MGKQKAYTHVNLGCGNALVTGYGNFDGSFSLFLSRVPLPYRLLCQLGLLKPIQLQYIQFLRENQVCYLGISKRIPLPSQSVEVLYSSHLVEHLTPSQLSRFLSEAMRVLKPGGVIRTAFPDIKIHVSEYLTHGNADELVQRTRLTQVRDRMSTFQGRLQILLFGDPDHKWMYDGESFSRVLESAGFVSAKILPAGETTIANLGELNLRQREHESAYVEAVRP